MIGYAIGSFIGIFLISIVYGFIHFKILKLLSEKIRQAWTHRSARFIILVICAIQAVIGLILYVSSCYMLYSGATYVPYVGAYGILHTGEDSIIYAWGLFGGYLALSVFADIFKAILVFTFAD